MTRSGVRFPFAPPAFAPRASARQAGGGTKGEGGLLQKCKKPVAESCFVFYKRQMVEVRQTKTFLSWLQNLSDREASKRIADRSVHLSKSNGRCFCYVPIRHERGPVKRSEGGGGWIARSRRPPRHKPPVAKVGLRQPRGTHGERQPKVGVSGWAGRARP